MVNNTDFEFISAHPLLLSIETKKPGVHWDKAQLQMGLWHAAQWSFFESAVGESWPSKVQMLKETWQTTLQARRLRRKRMAWRACQRKNGG